MPRERRKRTHTHEPSAKLEKRPFAVQHNAVHHVEIGKDAELSGQDILRSMDEEETRGAIKKKEKHQLRREAFIDKLKTTNSPYSKVQKRRFNRKLREKIGGGLDEIQAAISTLETEEIPGNIDSESNEKQKQEASQSRPKPGQIGEGKGIPLTKNQRKRALEMERLRYPLILSNPQYASNPFQTIRTHAQNTLLKHVSLGE
ncbi:ribosome biogenesis protein SLX9-domain-containing protein [Hygrophoropsis aurantiaca]|uniref:Ribosome biogenesis protein SLX9-domain-containing protein n=1 Tax=Hygrophoropsis aurantiaca TaxID=72124 RepID=A0ACB8AEH1_9AGAM|nr:ribosome biogenesis protein SLX9-domain-containing protein [Hygrophoropsis aurantiaca]